MFRRYLPLLCLCAGTALAADHRDAPIATGDPAADINDIYAFMNPNDPNEVILVNTVVPFANYNSRFSDAVEYNFHIDNGASDVVVGCRFLDQSNRVSCTGPNGLAASGGIERTVVGSGMRVWAGLRDDPFFFDLQGYKETLMTGTLSFDSTRDSFAKLNVSAIVLEISLDGIAGGSQELQVWATTRR